MAKTISKLRVLLREYPMLFKIAKSLHGIKIWIELQNDTIRKTYADMKILKKVSEVKKERCWFVCVPSHANLGDQAMAMAIRRWIKEKYPERELVELSRESLTVRHPNIMERIKNISNPEDIFFIQGGYTSGDKTTNEKAHRLLVSKLKDNRIVFFPQTVFYTSEKEKKKTADIYNEHGSVLFLARDRVSYKTIIDDFRNVDVRLYPDIVSSLIGRLDLDLNKNREGILFCIREDSEKRYSEKEIKNTILKLSKNYTVECADLMMSSKGQTPEEFEKIIYSLIEKMSSYKVIVTDRFHGILFGILSNTKVCAIDSIDFKVKEGALTFNELYPGAVYYAESTHEIINYIESTYNKENNVKYDETCFQKYYCNFREIVDEK